MSSPQMDVGLENVQDIKSMPNLVNEHKFKSQSQRYFVLKSAPSYFVSESAARYFVLESTAAFPNFSKHYKKLV